MINVSNRSADSDPQTCRRRPVGTKFGRAGHGSRSGLARPARRLDRLGRYSPDQHIEPLLVRAAHRRSYTLRSVALTEEEIAKFYSGFANEIIWPLFHDMPSRCNFDPEYWEIYQQVNRKFAKVVAETAHGRRLYLGP